MSPRLVAVEDIPFDLSFRTRSSQFINLEGTTYYET
jgi:hypothetical protein